MTNEEKLQLSKDAIRFYERHLPGWERMLEDALKDGDADEIEHCSDLVERAKDMLLTYKHGRDRFEAKIAKLTDLS